jgi:hypothetical protein
VSPVVKSHAYSSFQLFRRQQASVILKRLTPHSRPPKLRVRPLAPPRSTFCSESIANHPTLPNFCTLPHTRPFHRRSWSGDGTGHGRAALALKPRRRNHAPTPRSLSPNSTLEVLTALRLALYQLRKLDRIPPRAAIHESVELVKRARKRSAAPFVNAVLRKLAAAAPLKRHLSASTEELRVPNRSPTTFAHPLWLVERWVRAYGLAPPRQICQLRSIHPGDRHPPARSRRRERSPRRRHRARTPGALLASARRVQTANITKARALRAGQAVIQDEASQLVAALVGRGSSILDCCCAAPGGKTLGHRRPQSRRDNYAIELHPHRARLLQKLLRSAHPPAPTPRNIQIITADAQTAPLHAQLRSRPRRRSLFRHRHARPQS